MNKSNSKKIAETITFDQLAKMFNQAKEGIKDWTEVSSVNGCMTKGTSWNILFKALSPKIMTQKLAITNMIREFGEYLPENLKPKKEHKAIRNSRITHQEPKF